MLKPGMTGRTYPHITEIGLAQALENLSAELLMQGVKELWADSLGTFTRVDSADTQVSVFFEDANKRFAPSEIEDMFYDPDNNYKLSFAGLTDEQCYLLRSKQVYGHKYLVWKEGVWYLCQ